jgi:hypothetical protein
VAGQNPYAEKLDDLAAGLERLNAEAKVKAPECEELQDWLDEARSLVAEIREQRGQREDRDRLEQLVTAIMDDRLSELASAFTAAAVDADPLVLEEGTFLKAQVAGIGGAEGRPLFREVEIRLRTVRGELPEPRPKPSG